MDKQHILSLKQSLELDEITVMDMLLVEWTAIYMVHADSQVDIVGQRRIRASNLALVITISLLGLNDLVSKMDSDRTQGE